MSGHALIPLALSLSKGEPLRTYYKGNPEKPTCPPCGYISNKPRSNLKTALPTAAASELLDFHENTVAIFKALIFNKPSSGNVRKYHRIRFPSGCQAGDALDVGNLIDISQFIPLF